MACFPLMPLPIGRTIAFPRIIARTTTDFDTAATQHTIPLGSPVAGELVLVMFVYFSNPSVTVGVGSGWSAVTTVAQSNNLGAAWLWKIAAGGDSLRLDVNTNGRAAASVYRLRDAVSVTGSPFTSVASTTWNAANHVPAGGSKKYLWLPFWSTNATRNGNAPADYVIGGVDITGTSPFITVFERELEAASEDPAAFTGNAANQAGHTLAVHPT